MKLFELINTQDIEIKKKTSFDIDKLKAKRDKGINSPTGGGYAHGEVDKNDPHIFKKKTYLPTDLNKDGYYQYVKAIRPYIGDNPFYPRVYVVKVTRDKDGKVIPDYDIETLSNGEDFTYESLLSMAKKLYKGFPDNKIYYDVRPYIFRNLAKMMSENIKTGNYSNVLDSNLKGALNLIRKIIQKSNGNITLDLHKDNIMVRGTPSGPQLVITDPLVEDEKRRNFCNEKAALNAAFYL